MEILESHCEKSWFLCVESSHDSSFWLMLLGRESMSTRYDNWCELTFHYVMQNSISNSHRIFMAIERY